MMATIGLVILTGFSICVAASDEVKQEFRLPKSSVDAAERRLNSETDPSKKLQILLRWIKIKEEYEKTQIFEGDVRGDSKDLEMSKAIIISRIEKELPELFQAQVDVQPLLRELGFRYYELRNFEKSAENFQRVENKKPDDQLALGDAYVQLNKVPEALNAYNEASREYRISTTAAYKKAWAYMKLNDFSAALREFEIALKPNPDASSQLLEEAYSDRLRPYLETFQKPSFDQEEADRLKRLSRSIYGADAQKAKDLYVKGLSSLVQGFTDKSQIERAQNAFFFISQEIPDTSTILVLSAPTWIKVYRGRLEHAEVERIIDALPKNPIDPNTSLTLKAELHNTAVFYETFKDDEQNETTKEASIAVPMLSSTYGKYFQLYPKDKDADDLRANYAYILLEENNAKLCLDILADRGGQDVKTEKVASSLEGKCELKYLDQLYTKKHDDVFYERLSSALVITKIYERPDLGLPREQIFTSLVRMLMGALRQNLDSPILRKSLREVSEDFPLAKDGELFIEIRTTLAELRFSDLMADKSKASDKAPQFFEIYREAPAGTSVAEKSLTNSIVLGNNEETLDRCNVFQKIYIKNFKPSSGVFDRCIEISEHFLNLESEYRYWIPIEKSLNRDQKLRLGLLELGLKKSAGRDRILGLNDEKANQILELWEGAAPKKIGIDLQWQRLHRETQMFLAELKKIRFSQIQKLVPQRVKDFERMDIAVVRYYESSPEPIYMARSLALRSELAARMSEWMNSLPLPEGLAEEELKLYEAQTQQLVQAWLDRAAERKKQCGELAFSLTPDYKQNEAPDYCPEATPTNTLKEFFNKWRSSVQRRVKLQNMVKLILQRSESEEESMKAQYFLFRGLELSKTDAESARLHQALARLTKKDRFWLSAAALDGGLEEPIQWLKSEANGNPFFERLYSTEIRALRARTN